MKVLEAQKLLNTVLSKRPSDTRAMTKLAHLNLLSNDYPQSLHCIETALTSEKDHPTETSLFLAARIHLLMHEPTESLPYLTQCLEQN